ncbi:MAG: penicillin-insensitive murein endopeptidase [Nannocystis sp.]|nr:penicillin-insensitive murein endopeptidase [Nannocystis sp.]MBA3548293.1 penicillin-insensitive murein endopeptidase [Nannocystis sp.]
MRLRLAFASLAFSLGFLALVTGPADAAAMHPLSVTAPPDEAPPEPRLGAPAELLSDPSESEEGDEEIETVDVRELKPVAPRPRPVKKAAASKPAKDKKPKGKQLKGDAACGFRMPVYVHEVIEGDMVSSIAGRYGVRVGDIKKLNPSLKLDKIRIGQSIKVCPEIAPRLREEFTYTVKNGDSLSKIGEKYGLLATEIVRLQSGKLRRRLEANRNDLKLGDELTLVVDRGVLPEYAPKNEDRGTLKIAVQLDPGKAYFIKRPHLAYGTSHSVKAIKAALSRYKQSKAGKGGPQVHVGDISSRGGGPLTGHKSHQKGIDVDIGLVLKGSEANETRFRTGNPGNLDIARTWALIKAFVDNADVRAVFLDYNLQKLLYDHARQQKVSESTLDALFQYPRGKGRGFGIIRHWKGHRDHFHVRFKR